jgi:hypothetical protein
MHLGTIGVEVGGVDLWPCDDARSILCDLVMHGTGLSTPGRTTPGAAIPALGSIGVVGLWVARLPLLGPPPQLCIPTCQLGTGAGQHRIRVFIGCHHGEATVRDAGLGRLEYPSSDSC